MRAIFIVIALCVLAVATENVTVTDDFKAEEINDEQLSAISGNTTFLLADRVWECFSYVRAFKTDIELSSRDIYYADKTYESQPVIGIKSPLVYSSVITFDNVIKGSWSIEDDKFITQSFNGSERDEMSIVELTNGRFVTKTSSGLERVCKVKTTKFDSEILTANSWKCSLNEELGEPDTYIKMESINKYSSNGTSEVDGVIRLKLDSAQPELSYSIAYDEEWSYEDGRFKTKTGAVKIKNITESDNFARAFEEMINLENVFKGGTVDDMEILLFEEDSFVLQDLSSLGEERSKYSCKKVTNER
ncbi:MAG: hypothetical protein LBF13_00400 [Campylobacteraceae bacterium]|jgi:hypothetical protein|nr:hypothetical protein [Campylobacteraceae bacterium]